jgi:glutaredoxin
MNDLDKKILIFLAFVLVLLIGLFLFKQFQPFSNQENKMVLYWGVGCPHCEKVKSFIEQENLTKDLDIIQKEIYYDSSNAEELKQRAAECGIQTNKIGIPFLYYKGSCYMGDEPIINFLISKQKEVQK